MGKFTKESIQRLRDAIDIVEVISRTTPLKRSGGSMKGLCPFHAEKTPSFSVNIASKQYHCFGCGAHGDAVSFLMQQEGMSFTQAIQFLAERFQIHLEEETGDPKFALEEIKRGRYKKLLQSAALFFHNNLIYSDAGSAARQYLAARNLSLPFVRAFLIGYAPGKEAPSALQQHLHSAGFSNEEMIAVGLLHKPHDSDRSYSFFSGRITFPIFDSSGSAIGFSARKIDESGYGGKYINTPETVLFKKSRGFFGFFQSKKRIIRDKTAILVEGQIDALSLIYSGFDYTIATLGTAFGESHIETLKASGVDTVYLAFDSDSAGIQSAIKTGHLLMKRGISVLHVSMGPAKDPDECLRRYGRSFFFKQLFSAIDHIDFCLEAMRSHVNWSVAAEKEKALKALVLQIQEWDSPLLIHEAMKQLAEKAHVPLALLEGKPSSLPAAEKPAEARHLPQRKVTKKTGLTTKSGTPIPIDTTTERELDLIRWILLVTEESTTKKIMQTAALDDFISPIGRNLYSALRLIHEATMKSSSRSVGLIDIASELECSETEEAYIQYMIQKPSITANKAPLYIQEALQKIKTDSWMRQREALRMQIAAGTLNEEEQMRLLSVFAALTPPLVPPLG